MVLSLKYLGRVLSEAYDDWLAVIRDLAKAQAVCRRMTRIMIREGERPRVSGFVFKAIVLLVFLSVVDMWVVTPLMGRVLGFLQEQVVWILMERLPQRRSYGRWYNTLTEAAIEEMGFELMETYVCKRQSMVAQYVATQAILYLCKE